MDIRSAAGWAAGDREPTLPLRRVDSTTRMEGVVTTHKVDERVTHWYMGHTVGCTKPSFCPGCHAKCGSKYEAYVGFFSPKSKAHVILVLTVNAVKQMLDQLGRIDQVRGLQLTVWRQKKAFNSRVMVQCGMIYTDRAGLPEPFMAIEHLKRIWGIEHMDTAQNLDEKGSADLGGVVIGENLFSDVDIAKTLAFAEQKRYERIQREQQDSSGS